MPALIPPALEPFLDLLRCPVCRARLRPGRGSLCCPAGHTFDIARQGYVSLLSGIRTTSGDDAAMVQARNRFLATGRYGVRGPARAGIQASRMRSNRPPANSAAVAHPAVTPRPAQGLMGRLPRSVVV